MRAAWNVPRHLALIALAGLTSAGPVSAAYNGGLSPATLPGEAPNGSDRSAESQRRITLDFVEADIADIAKALSVQSGVNIVVSSSAKGKITLRLKGKTLDDALQFISRLAGLDYRQVGDTYIIGTAEELRSFSARSGVSETWVPRNLAPGEAKNLVQVALPYVTVQVQDKSNQVVLLGTAADVAAARRLLVDADAPGAGPRVVEPYMPKKQSPAALASLLKKSVPGLAIQVHERSLILSGNAGDYQQAVRLLGAVDVEAAVNRVNQIYQLKYLHPKNAMDTVTKVFPSLTVATTPEPFAPNPAQFSPLSIESKTTFAGQTVQSNEGSNGMGSNGQTKSRALILTGAPEDVAAGIEFLRSVDLAPPQVLIEARLVEVQPEKFKELGLQFNFSNTEIQEYRRNRGTVPNGSNGDQDFDIGRFIRTPFDIDVQLSALTQNKAARLLANPRIQVIDGEDANIFIGDLLRFRILRSVSAAGEQFDVETVPVGIALLVRPRVHDDGNVTLKVHPVVSTVTSFVGPERIPQTASREADSTIRMKDGETVAIGGLLREEDISIMSKVPGLGDLPLIGKLFTNKTTTKKKTEVTVFLTARIIR